VQFIGKTCLWVDYSVLMGTLNHTHLLEYSHITTSILLYFDRDCCYLLEKITELPADLFTLYVLKGGKRCTMFVCLFLIITPVTHLKVDFTRVNVMYCICNLLLLLLPSLCDSVG